MVQEMDVVSTLRETQGIALNSSTAQQLNLPKILYISYDGMTDPLGQSQVIPYLLGLSKLGYGFTILSFEKKPRFLKLEKKIRALLEPANIRWEPVWFTSRPPILAKFYDIIKMRRAVLRLQAREHFDLVHCRSYPSSENGLLLKRRFGVKFLFDMRGFWADEKKDGGAWNQHNFLYRRIYHHYKKKEKEFIQEADAIISLTEAGKNEMAGWINCKPLFPPYVIPCCADMTLFTIQTSEEKKQARQLLNLPQDNLVISYLGSLGSWYMLDEMLDFFKTIKATYPDAIFLFITHSPAEMVISKLKVRELLQNDILVVAAEREQVPLFAKAADFSVSFIKPVYSKISSSPTKLGELLSMGIPVIVNSGVGDVENVVKMVGGGIVINDFKKENYEEAAKGISEILNLDSKLIRDKAEKFYSLEEGIKSYALVYQKIFNI